MSQKSEKSKSLFKSFKDRLSKPITTRNLQSSSPVPVGPVQELSTVANLGGSNLEPGTSEDPSFTCADPSRSLDVTASSSNPYETLLPSLLIKRPSPSSETERMKEWGSKGWQAFKEALRFAQQVSDVLPPLKMAIGGLLAVIGHIDVCSSLNMYIVYYYG